MHCLQSNSLTLQYNGEKQASAGKDLDERCENLEKKLTTFMKTLTEQTKNGVFQDSLLAFLGMYTEDGYYLFSKFHTEFEISRLSFNSWGALK